MASTVGGLSGLRVVEVGRLVAAPFCGKLLADLGAEVIKVEPPGVGDPARRRRPFLGDDPHPERSGLFLYLNTSKLGITLDLDQPRARRILLDLLAEADVLVEDHLPHTLERWGLEYPALRAVNPRLVMTSITPFGHAGPYRSYQGNDLVYGAAGGLAYSNATRAENPREEYPFRLPGLTADFYGGLAAATATLAALLCRDLTDEGQHVDIALQQVVAANLRIDVSHLSYAGQVPSRLASAVQAIAIVGQQPTSDGFIDFVIRTEAQWSALVEVLGRPEWAANPLFATGRLRAENWDALSYLIQEETRKSSTQELFERSQAKGIPAAPVDTLNRAVEQEHFRQRGFFVEIDHAVAGRLRYPGGPVQYSEPIWGVRRPAPLLGEHTSSILTGRLGYTREEVVTLRELGVI